MSPPLFRNVEPSEHVRTSLPSAQNQLSSTFELTNTANAPAAKEPDSETFLPDLSTIEYPFNDTVVLP